MKVRWTPDEIAFLKTHYKDYGAKFCARHFNCSTRRIRIKASRLTLTSTQRNKASKICRGCYKRKALSEFSPHKICQLGLQSKCKVCRAKWESNRKKADKNYRLLHTIRNRIRIAIKKNCKSTSSKQLLGCDISFLKTYISNLFQPGMSWSNYGKWHLDHIVPCSYFDLSKQEAQEKCFHYTNLQPLWAKDNLSKGSKQCNPL